MAIVRWLVALALSGLGCVVSVWLIFFVMVETGPAAGAVTARPGGPVGVDLILGAFIIAAFFIQPLHTKSN